MHEIIIKALADTSLQTSEALNILLEIRIVHAIDALSLSLLIRLLDSGLTNHNNASN